MSRINPLGILLLVALVAVSASAQQMKPAPMPARPEITTQLIRNIINGKVLKDVPPITGSETLEQWNFSSDELKEIDILERTSNGNKMTVVIFMTTADAPGTTYEVAGGEQPSLLAGKLRLNFEYVTGEWVLLSVENLTMKYKKVAFMPHEG